MVEQPRPQRETFERPHTSRAPRIPVGHACAHCRVRHRTFCAALGSEDLARFKQLGPTVRVQAGQSLFRQGDTADFVFNITAGTVRLYKESADGRRQIAGFLYAGDCLGFTPDREHAFAAEAAEPSEFCRFPRAAFAGFMAARPELRRELYLITDGELANLREQIVMLGRGRAFERVATFLLQRFDRDCGGDEPEIVRLPMNRCDIADYLGVTNETVCRSFSALRRQGVIKSLAGRRIQLLARADLERLSARTVCGA